MTDLAIREDQPAEPQSATSSALAVWVDDAIKAHQVAQSLAKTSFVPASLRGKPEDITAAILAGQELGMQPMATLRSMDVIQGTPALRAHAMRGLVQSRGHQVVLVSATPDKVVMKGRRKGDEDWQEVTWTIARAQQLGLTGKDQWKKQPQTMLIARATGEVCRLVASDVLHAMPYAAEELDGYAITTARVRPLPQAQVTAAEIMGSAPEPTPLKDGEDIDVSAFDVLDDDEPDPTLDADWPGAER